MDKNTPHGYNYSLAATCAAPQSQERCRSGRSGLTRNQVYARAYRGFESHPLRQSKIKAGARSQRRARI